MKHSVSDKDQAYCYQFESLLVSAEAFDHRAHLRMAFIYLCESSPEVAYQKMKSGLLKFLGHHGVDPVKYHETMTYAWVLAVRHFMERASPAESFDQFISEDPRLLHFPIMLTHYSEERLFSDEARRSILLPDKQQIPTYVV